MTILTATDGEQVPSQAVATGYELATDLGEEHIVLHVMTQDLFDEIEGERGEQNVGATDLGRFEASPLGAGVSYRQSERQAGGSGSSNRYTIQDGESNAESVASDVVEATLDDGADVTVQGRVGEPVKEILQEAERRDVRYLVIGGRRRSPVGKAMFGSITQSILLNAELPVITVMRQD